MSITTGLSWRRSLIVVAIILLALVGVVWGAGGVLPVLLEMDRICGGVKVGGIDVGGLTVSEASARLTPIADALLMAPISLELGDNIWRVNPSDFGTRIEVDAAINAASRVGQVGPLRSRVSQRSSIRRRGFDIAWTVSVDEQALRDFVFHVAGVVSQAPKDARLIVTPEDKVAIEPAVEGRGLDVEALISALRSATLSSSDRIIQIPVTLIQPVVTTAEIEAMGIRRLVSHYTTTFNPANTNRVRNIRLAAQELDGTVLSPGEILSFNDRVGPRIAERGYLEADVLIDSSLVPDVGGGVCQVSTTLYNAALLAMMEVVSRLNHSLPSTYVPLGRDATVSWGTIDLQIRNSSKHHMLIRSHVDSDKVTIKVFGNIPDNMTASIQTEILEKIEPNTIEQVDPSSPTGSAVVVEKGSAGYRVAVWRVVKIDDVEVSRELISRDRYKPRPMVVKVGARASAQSEPGMPESWQAPAI